MPGVLFDARMLRPGMTGIGNYARSLLRAIPGGRLRVGILLPEGSPYAGEFPGFTVHFTAVGLTSHPWTDLYEQFWIPEFCRREGYEAFVSFEGRVPFFARRLRTFAFIYDFAFRRVPGTHGFKYSTLLRLSHWVAKASAAHVVTISEAVRGQISEGLGIPAERILVIPPSHSGLDRYSPLPTPGVRRPYLLATSLTNPRKNLGNLLRAYSLLREQRPATQLVLTGNPDWIERVLRDADDEGVVCAGFVSEGQLRTLYENADAFAYPSLDEGFGIPLLDARLAGCPVACSDIPVFREVLDRDAEFFDPLSPEDIARALARALDAPRNAGTAESWRSFSWEKSANKLVKALGGL